MRGRKPVPTVLRKLHGNPRKTALPKHEPMPVGDLTEPPDWLTEEQKANWNHAIANAPLGLLKRLDASALATWAVAVDLHRQATIAQSKVGLLVRVKTKATSGKDDLGVPVASPYVGIISQQAKLILKAASELGFTPVSRPRIVANRPDPAPPLEMDVESTETGRLTPMSIGEYLASAPPRPKMN